MAEEVKVENPALDIISRAEEANKKLEENIKKQEENIKKQEELITRMIMSGRATISPVVQADPEEEAIKQANALLAGSGRTIKK